MAEKYKKFTQRQQMLLPSYEIYHYRDSHLDNVALHHHDFYEVYLFLSGNVDYTIESRNYHLIPGDILLIGPLELHQPRITQEKAPYERMVLWIDKNFIEQFASTGTSLTLCFDTSQPNHTNLLRLPPAARQRVSDLMERLAAESTSTAYGAPLASLGLLTMLMVELHRQMQYMPALHETTDKADSIVTNVLKYINEHYHEPISLDTLSTRFFVNKYHLSHEFNRLVGTSVYRYVTQKRLMIAKQLLSDGLAPTDAYQHCGFGDYSNFYRAFKAEYGISPKEFIGSSQQTRT